MATIYERKNLDGSTTWRMMIRRKGTPTFCLSFSTYQEAEEWVEIHEQEYIDSPESYLQWRTENELSDRRDREFRRKKPKKVP